MVSCWRSPHERIYCLEDRPLAAFPGAETVDPPSPRKNRSLLLPTITNKCGENKKDKLDWLAKSGTDASMKRTPENHETHEKELS